MGGQSKINFAWKRGLSSVYMLLWTDEGGGRSTTNLGHELCGLIYATPSLSFLGLRSVVRLFVARSRICVSVCLSVCVSGLQLFRDCG